MFTFRFFASNADFASFSFFPTTPGTTTCGIPEPMLTCILTTSPAFAVEDFRLHHLPLQQPEEQ